MNVHSVPSVPEHKGGEVRMAVDGSLNFDTEVDTKGFKKGTKDVNSSVGEMKSMLDGFAKTAAAAFSVKKVIDLGKASVESAASVNAANSQITQTFGELESGARSIFRQIGSEAGILDTRLQGTGTSIYAFAKASGMGSAEALSMMDEALRVTADSAAYYDKSLEDTGESLRSFLKGNYANDAALGVSCTETTRNAAANRLYGKSFQELSEAQKQLVLLDMVSEANKLSGAEGQAAREAEGWENVTGNLKEAWGQFLAVVGQPILSAAVNVVQAMTSALSELTAYAEAAAAAVAEVFGLQQESSQTQSRTAQAAEQTADSYSAMADDAEKAEKAQDGSLASFDKINKIGSKNKAEDPGHASIAPPPAATAKIEFDTSYAKKDISKLTRNIKSELGKIISFLKKNFGSSFKGIWSELSNESLELYDTLEQVFTDIASLEEPLKNSISRDLVPALSASFEALGGIAAGLFDSFNIVFADIWDLAVFPMLTSLVTDGLPIAAQFGEQLALTLQTAFDVIKELFDTLWVDIAEPILSGIATLWADLWQSVSDFWSTWGVPVFEGIREALESTGELIGDIWDKWFSPVWENITAALSGLWDEHMKPLIDDLLDLAGEFADCALKIYNKFIMPLMKWIVDTLSPALTGVFEVVVNALRSATASVIDIIGGVVNVLKGIIQFVSGVFTADWQKAWQGIKNAFKGVWDSLVAIVKAPINLMIDLINGFTGAVQTALNWVIDKINLLSFDVPEWVPGIGGESFGFDLDHISIPEIPHLARGTVIPANYGEFTAILGDNKREAEVVSPLSVIRQAVLEALKAYGPIGGSDPVIYVLVDGDEISYRIERRQTAGAVRNGGR